MDSTEKIFEELIRKIGENPERDGLKETPRRVAELYKFLTRGYSENVDKIVNGAVYSEENNNMVIVKDIEFFSLCEHHLMPFFGKCHIAYIPNGKIIGLSKLPRIVDMFSRRLQVQERLTNQIANEINKILQPSGVAIVMDAAHLCMMMRGVEKQNSSATASAMHGVFKEDARTRSEFLTLISSKQL